MNEEFARMVERGRSVRRYKGDVRIPHETLLRWIDLARITPNGLNAQVLRYRLADDDETCAKLFDAVVWAGALKDWPGPEPDERPHAYIGLFAEGSGARAEIDLGIAAQTLMLAAVSEGYAACMFKSFKPAQLSEILGVDAEKYTPMLLMCFGAPNEEVRLEPLEGAPNGVKYWRDEAGVHHVPKRSLEDVLL